MKREFEDDYASQALSTQHAALSTQHSARSTQHAARSTQHAARSLRGLISRSSDPAALFSRRFAFPITYTLFAACLLVPFHAHAETGTCSPESANDHGVLQKKQEWYSNNWQAWKTSYYAVETKVDAKVDTKIDTKIDTRVGTRTETKVETKAKADPVIKTGKRKAIRDQYVDARLDLANEYFRRFVSGICGRVASLQAADDKSGDGSGIRLMLNQLIATRAAKITQLKEKLKQGDEKYPLFEAEQDLSDLELSSMLPAAATSSTTATPVAALAR